MFSRVSERKMLAVRTTLLAAWLILIGSAFYDPFSAALTEPDNLSSPFRIKDDPVMIQGVAPAAEPYQMATRIFWTMALPLVPVFLMLFGHEAWRRVCPLSFASQFARYLGIQRRGRRTVSPGQKGALSLIQRGSWLQRNAWYVQFGLLYAGVCARILFINSSRTTFACVMLAVIVAAIVVGFLWGGKTWCNYICPANVVQRIYTEPAGLLESSPSRGSAAIPQSMCRTSTPEGDKSACVGCQSHCGDIDLESAYWNTISDAPRKHVYYMFTGLVLGFYGYYYLYAGNWDYYFSGIWTHESGQLAAVLGPGFYLGGRLIQIPKLLAVPLALAAAMAVTWVLSSLCERGYRYLRSKGKPIAAADITHHCLTTSAYVSFNLFYLFAGRPNLNLLPEPVLYAVNALLMLVSTLWLWRTLRRSSPGIRQQCPTSSSTDVPLTTKEIEMTRIEELRRSTTAAPTAGRAPLHGAAEEYETDQSTPWPPALGWEMALLSDPQAAPWAGGKTELRCVNVTPETEDVKTYTFVSASPGVFCYQPGQYVTLEVYLEGRWLRRSYTISSSPSRPHALSITVKRVNKGWISNWLYETMSEGMSINVSGPHGDFSCVNHPAPKLLLLSAGSGVTPMMSMLRCFSDLGSNRDIVFINNVRTPKDIIFRQELYQFGTRLSPSLRMTIVPSVVPPGEVWTGPTGRFSEQLLISAAPDFMERETFVCGPPEYMQSVRDCLEQLGYPMTSYHEESFSPVPSAPSKPATVAAPKPAASRPVATRPPSTSREFPKEQHLAARAPVRLHAVAPPPPPPPRNQENPAREIVFLRKQKSFPYRAQETILAAAERAGIELKSACRSGVCGTCRVNKVQGQVRMDDQGVLSQSEIDAGEILSCVSYPEGQVMIDA